MILTEKYRPRSFDEFIGQNHVVGYLRGKIAAGETLPHLIFASPIPGVGKTTLAYVLKNELDTELLEFNASDDRGISFIRETIKNSAKAQSLSGNRKIILLDEADGLTPDAQHALRRIMEKYGDNTLFILSCNHLNKIIDAVQSRCIPFRFYALTTEEVTTYIRRVAEGEGLDLGEDRIRWVAENCGGSLRNALNLLDLVRFVEPDVKPDPYLTFKPVYDMIKTRAKPPEEITKLAMYSIWRGFGVDEFLYTMMVCIRDDTSIPQKTQVAAIRHLGEFFLATDGNLSQEKMVGFTTSYLYKLLGGVKRG